MDRYVITRECCKRKVSFSVSAVELKEGTTVDILIGTNKDRVAICKATISKVCGELKLRYSLRDQNLLKEWM